MSVQGFACTCCNTGIDISILQETLVQLEIVPWRVRSNTACHPPGFGKPKFPDPEKITQSTALADFAGKDSWFTMNILQINDKFLADNVDTWPESSAYLQSLSNVGAVNVINDAEERGVKLSADFLAAAQSEEHYVLQVVEQDRKRTPNLRKRKLNDTT